MIPEIFPRSTHVSAVARVQIRPRVRQGGFSLYELIITLAIVCGLMLGSIGMYGLVRDQRLTSEINQLLGHLALARSEAITRGYKVALCPTVDNRQCEPAAEYTRWDRGLLLFADTNGNGQLDADEKVIRVHSAADNNVRIKSSRFRPHVVYQSNGLASGTTITFTFCDARGASRPRYVIISNTGRGRVAAVPPDGKADEGLERCP